MQGVTGRRAQLRTKPSMTDNTLMPAYPRADQELVLMRKVFQDLAESHAHPERGHPGSLRQEIGEGDITKRPPAKLGEDGLLAKPGLEFVKTGWRRIARGPRLVRGIGQRIKVKSGIID